MDSTGIHTLAAGEQMLTAWLLEELAELVGCALDAGDPVDRLRRLDRGTPQPLTGAEFARLPRLLTSEPS